MTSWLRCNELRALDELRKGSAYFGQKFYFYSVDLRTGTHLYLNYHSGWTELERVIAIQIFKSHHILTYVSSLGLPFYHHVNQHRGDPDLSWLLGCILYRICFQQQYHSQAGVIQAAIPAHSLRALYELLTVKLQDSKWDYSGSPKGNPKRQIFMLRWCSRMAVWH